MFITIRKYTQEMMEHSNLGNYTITDGDINHRQRSEVYMLRMVLYLCIYVPDKEDGLSIACISDIFRIDTDQYTED